MVSAPEATASERGADGLDEAARLHWREDASEATLRRDGRRWTAWTAWIVTVFCVPGVLLLAIEPLTFPAAAICFAHAWAIPRIQARRGARQVVPIGSERSAARRAHAAGGPERVALGLLGDLVGHDQRDLLAATGLALERGGLGVWLIGEQGAILVRPGGRRVDCWCVRVAENNRRLNKRCLNRGAARLRLAGGVARLRSRGAAGGRPRRPPAARPARGRAGVCEGGEPRLLGGALAGAAAPAGGFAAGARRGARRGRPSSGGQRLAAGLDRVEERREDVGATQVELLGAQRSRLVEGVLRLRQGQVGVDDPGAGVDEDLASSACAQTAPKLPVLAPITATGLFWSTVLARGREAQSIAFFSTPGMEALYSGVAISRASADAIARQRSATGAGARSVSLSASTGDRPQAVPDLYLDAAGRRSAMWRSRRALWESRRRLPAIARIGIVVTRGRARARR